MRQHQILESMGYSVISIWSHEFEFQLRTHHALQRFVATLDLQDRMTPRSAFYGGRTEVFRMRCDQGVIHYLDFNGLYISVLMQNSFPVGTPQVITRDFLPLDSYFGIATVKIEPPRGDYLPVLPWRNGRHLLFGSCATHMASEERTPCRHSIEERCLVGSWCIPEILKAVERGYTLHKIYEVLHWSETSKELFREYGAYFVARKDEANGYPDHVHTEADKQRYVDDYYKALGIRLVPEKIEENKAKRFCAKQCTNNFWGKLAENSGAWTRSSFGKTAKDVYDVINHPGKILHNFHIIDDNNVLLEWRDAHAVLSPSSLHESPYLACFTTSFARLKLFELLAAVQKGLLYCDTDSAVFRDDGDYHLDEGPYVGQLKNELTCSAVSCPGCPRQSHAIVDFVALGPKNYAYLTDTGSTVCKIRGFTLNSECSELLNFHTLKDMAEGKRAPDLSTPRVALKRDKSHLVVRTVPEPRRYRVDFRKRILQKDFDTLPYGY